MVSGQVQRDQGVTLIGGAPVSREDIEAALKIAPHLMAADGGANAAISLGFAPEAVIGDFDSLSDAARAALPEAALIHDADQNTTDFEKCQTRIKAPFLLALGFDGARLDHTLAACGILAKRLGPPTILVSSDDVLLALDTGFEIDLAPGTRVSLFPMQPMKGKSKGLRWPIDGLTLSALGRLGTSNEATGPVALSFDAPGTLLILPRQTLPQVLKAVSPG